MTFIRRNVWALSEEEVWHPIILGYALAIDVLQRRTGADDPTRWQHQTEIHWAQGVPANEQFRNQCQHGTWHFLPWHRMYLVHLEAILRAALAEVGEIDAGTKAAWALPYWDYTTTDQWRALPPAFRRTTLPDGRDNPLFQPTRTVNNGEKLRPEAVRTDAALRAGRFETVNMAPGFGGPKTGFMHNGGSVGVLEGTPHGAVHNGLGKPMNSTRTASTDPIFYLHHANIDRLWQVWLEKGQGRVNPTSPDWTGQTFWFYDADGEEQDMTASQVLDTVGQLHYEYEDTSIAGPLEDIPVEPEPEHPAQLVGATERPVTLIGDTTSIRFAIAAPAGPLDAQATSRVYLQLTDITSADGPAVPYAVYLNVPDDDETTPDDHFAGTMSTFGAGEFADPDSDVAEGLRVTFDITDLYRSLLTAGQWSDEVTIRLVPLYLEPPPGPLDAADMVPGAAEEPGSVSVGQVGVFFQ